MAASKKTTNISDRRGQDVVKQKGSIVYQKRIGYYSHKKKKYKKDPSDLAAGLFSEQAELIQETDLTQPLSCQNRRFYIPEAILLLTEQGQSLAAGGQERSKTEGTFVKQGRTRGIKALVNNSYKYQIPIIGIVDSNTDPFGIQYPIPGNNDTAECIGLYLKMITKAILETKKKEVKTFASPKIAPPVQTESRARHYEGLGKATGQKKTTTKKKCQKL